MRPGILVLNHFPTMPTTSGGKVRTFSICKALSSSFQVELLTLAPFDSELSDWRHNTSFSETNVPLSAAAVMWGKRTQESTGITADADCITADLAKLTPAYLYGFRKSLKRAQIVGLSHPFLAPILEDVAPHLPVWLDMHNFEAGLVRGLGNDAVSIKTELVEASAWRKARIISYCSATDISEAVSLYGNTSSPSVHVPNGSGNTPDSIEEDQRPLVDELRRQLGLRDHSAIFVGSDHPPNRECIGTLVQLARELPNLTILVVGSVCNSNFPTPIPTNIIRLGVVSERLLSALYRLSSLALNPITSGSGSNVKMLEYMAHGVPIVSTRFGARGIDIQADTHYVEAELEELPLKVASSLEDRMPIQQMAARAQLLAQASSWRECTRELSGRLTSLLDRL